MKTTTLLCALALLAGCADGPPATTGHETVSDPDVPLPEDATVHLEVSQSSVTTRNATFTLTGSTDTPALVSVLSNASQPEPFEANGTWEVELLLPHGRTVYTIRADDGEGIAETMFTATRLSQVTVQVTYRGDVGMEDRDDSFWFDISAMASRQTGDHDGCAQAHPGHPNVHDAMLEWTAATGHVVTYGSCGDFGVSVEAIEDHESPGFWCYEVNGEPADFGISLQPLAPGDVVVWDDCALVLG